MNTNLEDQLAAGMRDETAGLTFTRDVLAQATRRHHRRITLHRTAYAAGTIGVIGALAATLTIGSRASDGTGSSPWPVAAQPTATSADTPRLRLSAAAAASENISYRVKVTVTIKDELPPKGELPEPVSQSWITTGAFDPVTATGYLESPYTGLRPVIAAGFEHERLVNGVRYVGSRDGLAPDSGKIVWWRYAGKQDHLDYGLASGGGLATAAGPQQLFSILREAGGEVTETAPGTYHFELTTKTTKDDRHQVLADHFVGEVKLGTDNRIATVTYDRAVQRSDYKGEPFTYHLHVVTELSDYGMPVRVDPPAHFFTQPSR